MDVIARFVDSLSGAERLALLFAAAALVVTLVADARRRRAARARADALRPGRPVEILFHCRDELTPALQEAARATRALEATVSAALRAGRGCLPDRELAPGEATIVIGADAQVQANVRERFARTGSVHVATEIAPGTWSVMRALAPKAPASTPATAEGARV